MSNDRGPIFLSTENEQRPMSRRDNKSYRAAALVRRKGAVYVAVLMTTMIVSVTALAGLTLLDMRLQASRSGTQALSARAYADSATAIAIARINQDANWRTTYQHGVATSALTIDGGTVWWKLENNAANLTNQVYDAVNLTGYSKVGEAVSARQVTLVGNYSPMNVLSNALSVYGNLSLGKDVSITTDGAIVCNGSFSGDATAVTGSSVNVYGSGTGLGSLLGNTVTSLTNPVSQTVGSNPLGAVVGTLTAELATNLRNSTGEAVVLPDTNWKDFYLAAGTEITLGALPNSGGYRTIEKTVLSANSNPFGSATNISGIYFIQCGGSKVQVRNCRIHGTLLLVDPHKNSQISGAVNWSPTVKSLPALLVEGAIELAFDSLPVVESTVNANLNPSTTPYRGESNNDKLDSYPSQIEGFSYISGSAEFPNGTELSVIKGALAIGGSLAQNSPLAIHRDDELLLNPPPGFRTYQNMQVQHGTSQSVNTQ